MVNRVYEYMIRHKMFSPGSRVLAAVSGGADSMCLLEVLRTLRLRAGFELRVLHVHHGLRESAEGDLVHVSKYCRSAGIPFQAVRVDAGSYAAKAGMSVEEAARYLRYGALEEAAREWENEAARERENEAVQERMKEEDGPGPDPLCRIAVAHHIEDQAETVLFNLVRGSRLTGLRGMQPISGRVIRPLLEVSRPEIEAFLTKRGILWCEDETNGDLRYTRNLIRKEVMPLLLQINAGAVRHIARTAGEAAETEEFLRAETERALESCCREKESPLGTEGSGTEGHGNTKETGRPACPGPAVRKILIPELMREPALIRRRAVYMVLAEAAGGKKDLQDVHVQDVLHLMEKQGNGELDLVRGVHVKRSYDTLYIYGEPERGCGTGRGTGKEDAAKDAAASAAAPRAGRSGVTPYMQAGAGRFTCRVFPFDGDLSAVPRNQCTKWFDYDKIGAFPEFRNRREGDRIALDESGRTKTIARYMIDDKIPRELREEIVMPAAGNDILWVPVRGTDSRQRNGRSGQTGGRISAAYKVSSETRTVLEIRWEPGCDR